MMGFAELFLSHGFTVLIPDSRAHGESGGDFSTYGLKESDDVHRWFDWLVIQQHSKCIFGMGESMGAAILLQALEKREHGWAEWLCDPLSNLPSCTAGLPAVSTWRMPLPRGQWLEAGCRFF